MYVSLIRMSWKITLKQSYKIHREADWKGERAPSFQILLQYLTRPVIPGRGAADTTSAVGVVTTVSSGTWGRSSQLMVPEAQLQGSSAGSGPGPIAGEHYHPLHLLSWLFLSTMTGKCQAERLLAPCVRLHLAVRSRPPRGAGGQKVSVEYQPQIV